MSDPLSLSTEHACVDRDGNKNDGDWWRCIEGRVFGPCDSEHCYGVCEYKGACTCECHVAEASGSVVPPV